MARSITLHSPMTPEAIAHKLQTLLHDVPKQGCVTGNGDEETMKLFFYRPNFQNSLRCELNAEMTPDGGGTRIAGRIGTPPSGNIFMGCWVGFAAIFLAFFGGITFAVHAPIGVRLPFLLIPLGMIAFGIFMWWAGTHNRREDDAAILAFLAETLDARPA